MPGFRAVVTDLDDTLYSWVDYIVPSLEAIVAREEIDRRQGEIGDRGSD